MAAATSELKLPDISTQTIYAGKYKDWTPNLRPVCINRTLTEIMMQILNKKCSILYQNVYDQNKCISQVRHV